MRVILFDVDGTLVRTHGAGRRAMQRALLAVYGTAGAIATYNMAGKTDRMIIYDLLAAEGLSPAEIESKFPAYERAYAQALEEELRRQKPEVLPGVMPLLEALRQRDDVLLGLLTGNLVVGARLKLQFAGIDPDWFVVTAFGNDGLVRDDLARVALRRARAVAGASLQGEHAVVVGDTPLDIQCARAVGAKSVAVATGPYSVETLAQHGADAVLADFSDTAASLQAVLNGRMRPRGKAPDS